MVDTGQGLVGTNMFAYCENNPVMRCDPTGTHYDAATNTFFIDDPDIYYRYYSDRSKWVPGTTYYLGAGVSKDVQMKSGLKYYTYKQGSVKPGQKNIPYRGGTAHIVSSSDQGKKLAASLPDRSPAKNVIIVDSRRTKPEDPNMQVMNAVFCDSLEMSEICLIMLDYEKTDESDWERTFSSLYVEWDAHFFASVVNPIANVFGKGEEQQRFIDVDFNNGDEGKSHLDFLAGY